MPATSSSQAAQGRASACCASSLQLAGGYQLARATLQPEHHRQQQQRDRDQRELQPRVRGVVRAGEGGLDLQAAPQRERPSTPATGRCDRLPQQRCVHDGQAADPARPPARPRRSARPAPAPTAHCPCAPVRAAGPAARPARSCVRSSTSISSSERCTSAGDR